MGVNGRDGTVFDNSYERAEPVDFPLTGVVKGFQKAIAGQKVGSTVGVAMTSADGYPDGRAPAPESRTGRLARLRDQDPQRFLAEHHDS